MKFFIGPRNKIHRNLILILEFVISCTRNELELFYFRINSRLQIKLESMEKIANLIHILLAIFPYIISQFASKHDASIPVHFLFNHSPSFFLQNNCAF